MEDKTLEIKIGFENFFDSNVTNQSIPNTYAMGVCRLDYDMVMNRLTVHLRRPGLLIGKGGRTINELQDYLECTVQVEEVNIYKV